MSSWPATAWTVPELVARLRDLGETERIEAKRGLGDAALETVSAFSNEPDLGGGWILFGVERKGADDYRVVGVADADRLQSDLAGQCRNRLNRPVRPHIQVELVEGVHNTFCVLGPAATERTPRPPASGDSVARLGDRAEFDEVRLRYWQPAELARLVGRNPRYLRDHYLIPLVDQGRLRLRHASRRHPQQAYIAAEVGE